MNYELAKKLKDAGFPQQGDGQFIKQNMSNPLGWYKTFTIYIPTLSELIEVCGDKLRYIQRIESSTNWVAGTYDSHKSGVGLPDSNVWKGETPEEAVAHLYLALKDARK